jgi:hypothetical protein
MLEAQAEKIYTMIDRANANMRMELRTHNEGWLRMIFEGWERGEDWSRVDVWDMRWYDAEKELEVLFEWEGI